MTTKVHVRFWMVKIWHALVFCALPIYLFGFFPWLLGFLVMNIVAGFMLSIVFQLAHTVEHTDFPVADADTNKFQDEFAAHQIKTTANFGTKNKFVSWYVGGLNFRLSIIYFLRFLIHIIRLLVVSLRRCVTNMS